MGLLGFSFTSDVLTRYRASATEHVAAVRQIAAEEKRMVSARLDGIEKSMKSISGFVNKLASVGMAANSVAQATKFAFDAIEKYGNHLDLVGTAGKVSLDGLSKAALGLKTNMELLEHAATLNRSAFKFTQEQLETVEKAMFVLEERGHKSEAVWNAVESALTKGVTKPLIQMGIVLDTSGNKFDENGLKMDTYGQRAKAVSQIMGALATTAKEADGAQLDAADSVQATTTRLKNYWDQAILKIGELATKLAPVIDMFANIAGMLGAVASKVGDVVGYLKYINPMGQGYHLMKDQADISKVAGTLRGGLQSRATPGMGADDLISGIQTATGRILGAVTTAVEKVANDPWRHAGLKRGTGKAVMPGYTIGASEYGGISQLGGIEFGGPTDISTSISSGMLTNAAWQRETEVNAAYNQFQKSKLEAVFGPLQDFDAYATAFQTLQGAVGSALTAWIDGSMSAGKAVKQFIAEALKGVSVQMAMEALKHGAFAIGSLAFGDFRGASLHAKAAALHVAGSAAAAVASKSLHGGGGGGGAGAGASPQAPNVGGGAGGAASGGQGSHVTIVYGGTDIHGGSDRQQMLHARRIIGKARGATHGAVEWR